MEYSWIGFACAFAWETESELKVECKNQEFQQYLFDWFRLAVRSQDSINMKAMRDTMYIKMLNSQIKTSRAVSCVQCCCCSCLCSFLWVGDSIWDLCRAYSQMGFWTWKFWSQKISLILLMVVFKWKSVTKERIHQHLESPNRKLVYMLRLFFGSSANKMTDEQANYHCENLPMSSCSAHWNLLCPYLSNSVQG